MLCWELVLKFMWREWRGFFFNKNSVDRFYESSRRICTRDLTRWFVGNFSCVARAFKSQQKAARLFRYFSVKEKYRGRLVGAEIEEKEEHRLLPLIKTDFNHILKG